MAREYLSKRVRITLHVGYWVAVLAFYVLYFGARPDEYGQNLVFAAMLLPITIATTYFILYRLIPRYLMRRRYGLFALYLFYTLIVSFWLELALVVGLYMTVSDYQAMVVAPDFPGLLDAILGMYLFVSIAVAAHLTKSTLTANLRLKDAELELLKSRVHPHFLFNALNSLYALATEKSDDAPELILRLSTLMDYMLYKADRAEVTLGDEVDMLRAYVEFESIRASDRAEINLGIHISNPDLAIPPLLLLPLVENAFKHGVRPTAGTSRVDIALRESGDAVQLRVENTIPPPAKQAAPKERSGLGLRNLRQRLAHSLTDAHELTTRALDDRFEAHLTLDLS